MDLASSPHLFGPARPTASDLQRLAPFQTLSQGQLEVLAALAHRRRLEPHEMLFDEGAPSDALYVIEEGHIRVRGRLTSGETRTLATLGRGDLVGEMGIFEGRPRSSQAIAAGPVTVLEIAAHGLLEHVASDPQGAADLLAVVAAVVSERLRRTNARLLTLFQVGRQLAQANDLDLLAHPVLEQLLEGVRAAEGAMLWLVNEVHGELELRGLVQGRGRALPIRALEAGHSTSGPALPPGDALQHLFERIDGAVELANLPAGTQLKEWLEGRPRVLAAPLRARAHLDGGILLLDFSISGRFAPGDADLLAAVAAQLEGAIERLQHQHEQRDRLRLEQPSF